MITTDNGFFWKHKCYKYLNMQSVFHIIQIFVREWVEFQAFNL